jgi:hypothetical protein
MLAGWTYLRARAGCPGAIADLTPPHSRYQGQLHRANTSIINDITRGALPNIMIAND